MSQPSVGAASGGAVLSRPTVAVPLALVHQCFAAVAAEDRTCTGADRAVHEHLCRWVLHAGRHLQRGVQLAPAQGWQRQLRHGHRGQVGDEAAAQPYFINKVTHVSISLYLLYPTLSRCSGGLGMELARLLYKDGFNLVLVSRDATGLQDLKDSLETTAADAQQGRLGPPASRSREMVGEGDADQGGENKGDDLGSQDYEHDNALARRNTHPHSRDTTASISSSSSPISRADDCLDTDSSGTQKLVSASIIETAVTETSATTKQQQHDRQLSAAKVLLTQSQSSTSSSRRRRHSHRRSSSSSGSSASGEFDQRVTHPPQHPPASTPSTPASPSLDDPDVPPSSSLQRLPPPHQQQQHQQIVLIPADLSSRYARSPCTSLND